MTKLISPDETWYDSITYCVPTEFVPNKRHIVGNGEGPVLVEDGQLAAAAGPSGEPDHDGVLLLPPRLEEEVEHPAAIQPHKPAFSSTSCLVSSNALDCRYNAGSSNLFHSQSQTKRSKLYSTITWRHACAADGSNRRGGRGPQPRRARRAA